MSLHKAIKSGKEHRVEYGTKNQPYAKAVDETCRNHGGRRGKRQCPYCLGNRTYRDKKLKQKFDYDTMDMKCG